jgi:hypothetical protein
MLDYLEAFPLEKNQNFSFLTLTLSCQNKEEKYITYQFSAS